MFRVPLILFVFISFVGCDQNTTKINQDFDRTGSPQKITVFVYNSEHNMQKAKADFLNELIDDRLKGWAKWTNSLEDGCEIHVVKVSSANDTSQMTTWGHELTHCLYGMFHKEFS